MAKFGAGSVGKEKTTGMPAGALLAGTVGLLALPSAVLALSSRLDPRQITPPVAATDVVQPGAFAANLAPAMPVGAVFRNSMFRFTPAGIANRPERSVTVAVRVDPQWQQTILVLGSSRRVTAVQQETLPLQIAPTAFSLGVAKGYHSFAQNLVPNATIRNLDMPDLASLKGSVTPQDDRPSRFNPKIVLDQRQTTGRAPRTFSASGDIVDVGGSYRVTGNLDVTAGLRYTQENDRLRPLTDKKKDNQAVYVGTQFRF